MLSLIIATATLSIKVLTLIVATANLSVYMLTLTVATAMLSVLKHVDIHACNCYI